MIKVEINTVIGSFQHQSRVQNLYSKMTEKNLFKSLEGKYFHSKYCPVTDLFINEFFADCIDTFLT